MRCHCGAQADVKRMCNPCAYAAHPTCECSCPKHVDGWSGPHRHMPCTCQTGSRWRYLAWFDVHRAKFWQMVCVALLLGAVTFVIAAIVMAPFA